MSSLVCTLLSLSLSLWLASPLLDFVVVAGFGMSQDTSAVFYVHVILLWCPLAGSLAVSEVSWDKKLILTPEKTVGVYMCVCTCVCACVCVNHEIMKQDWILICLFHVPAVTILAFMKLSMYPQRWWQVVT